MYRFLWTALLLVTVVDAANAQGRSRGTLREWDEESPYWSERDERPSWGSRGWREVPPTWRRNERSERWGWERVPDPRWRREWSDEDRRYRSSDRWQSWDEPRGQKVMDGGGRPNITPMSPQRIAFGGSYEPGTIVIDTRGRQLLLVQGGGMALRYPISVGRQGFAWTGTEKISRIADWPDWHPPAEMRQREPHLPEKMIGGIRNPLGAKALYLGNSLYRIHGTNDARSIGLASSSGCFRMLNGHVVDLAGRVDVGTKVVVVSRLSHTASVPR